ncbi:MAG: alpha-ketoglutarate-dependent dioxygenase AlkB [Bacteroidota bacterium]|nr:alpha-ketoglutarate-dependent dioxygenase AlkB [Bacteroidota bacterium]
MQEPDLQYIPNFIDAKKSDELFQKFKENIHWNHEQITLFGKKIFEPRLTAWFGSKSYKYSGKNMQPQSLNSDLEWIIQKINSDVGLEFNTVLLNYYRNGTDSMGWHSDDEKELGPSPIIASISMGAERTIHFRLKENHKIVKKCLLHHGSLLIMKGNTQLLWQHALPKVKNLEQPRINLTFRKIN